MSDASGPLRAGQMTNDDHRAPAGAPILDGGRQASEALPRDAAVEALCAELTSLHRQQRWAMTQRMAVNNRLGAFVRLNFAGWRFDAPEKERAKAAKRAADAVKALGKGEPSGFGPAADRILAPMVDLAEKARAPFEQFEDLRGKEMTRLAAKLPPASFVASVRGLGLLSLARIVGEAGPLHLYATPSKLWKRMGLAVIGGERQRGVRDAEEAKLQGYSPRRRSVSWVAFSAVFRAQKAEDLYRQLYDAKKAAYMARVEACEAKWTKARAHAAASRYAEKQLLLDLWKAWRRGVVR